MEPYLNSREGKGVVFPGLFKIMEPITVPRHSTPLRHRPGERDPLTWERALPRGPHVRQGPRAVTLLPPAVRLRQGPRAVTLLPLQYAQDYRRASQGRYRSPRGGACQPPYPARLVEDQQLGDVLYLQRFYGAHGHHEPKRACTVVQHLAASVAATAHRSCARSATQQHLFGPQPASPLYVMWLCRQFGQRPHTSWAFNLLGYIYKLNIISVSLIE
jgi:hypothetical protein